LKEQTSLFGLIGHPVSKSLSPRIHNAAFKKLGINAVYIAFDVPEGGLTDVVKGFRYICRGFNVTIPHKSSIIPLLDEVDPVANKIGAVNTVKVEGGRLIGTNTDWSAFKLLLEPHLSEFENALILGAGGAAKACIYALYELGFKKITVLNRTLKRAEELRKELERKLSGVEITVRPLKADYVSNPEVFVNATPMGMYGDPSFLKSVIDKVRRSIVVDMAYSVNGTFLDKTKPGIAYISGIDILVEQAAQAFEFWTGLKAPRDVMRRAVRHED